ncbi:hypothetical protein [Nonomuraea maheshkhaliensis]|uniref:hypothetical protein n=1 Tax=Nonomuraea maheshkhaliensis TaxID=419590 RepID=UPI0031F827AF
MSVAPAPPPDPAEPPQDAPAESPPTASDQDPAPEPRPSSEPQVEETQVKARPAPAPEPAAVISLALLPYIAPWAGALMILGALGWIFAYDDLAADYTSPAERVQLTVSLWFMVVVLLASSATTGFTAYTWSRDKAVTDDNEERWNANVAIAVLGPPIAIWLVIARRAVMF